METFHIFVACKQIIKSTVMRHINIKFLKEAEEFLDGIPEQARNKIYYNMIKISGGLIEKDLFKKLEGTEIWEFRTLYGGSAYRLLAFWDKMENSLVVATHGFLKKTQKTPAKEIARAEAIMGDY